MADWDADTFEPEEPIKKAAAMDKWEGEDEEEDVKDNWDDDEEDEEKKAEVKKTEVKVSEKKKLSEKIKEKENRLKKKQHEQMEQQLEEQELDPEEQLAEKLRVKKLQEEADLELAKDAFGVSSSSNCVSGIDAMCPSSKEDFTEFEKMLKEKISQFEKSVHYSSLLESLFRELCISLEVEDLKKISNSLSVLLSEKQKQEKVSASSLYEIFQQRALLSFSMTAFMGKRNCSCHGSSSFRNDQISKTKGRRRRKEWYLVVV